MTCPNCGLSLPVHARFCGRCGAQLPAHPDRPVPVWAIVVLAVGAMVAAIVTVSYGVLLAAPDLAAGTGSKLDPAQVRLSAGLLVAAGGVMLGLQLGGLIGLALGRRWGRVVATLAAAGWALTCLGLPVAALLLHLVWRTGRPQPNRV